VGLKGDVTDSKQSLRQPPRSSKHKQAKHRSAPAGLATRQAAVRVISAVLTEHRSLDDALGATEALEPRDRGLARLIAGTVIRRHGELEAVLKSFLSKALPRKTGALWPIMLSAAAQLLMLETPAHAAISLAVDQCQADKDARHFDKLANAVLRKAAAEGPAKLAAMDGIVLNIPPWLWRRWVATYGEPTARAIAAAQLRQAPLDISVKSDAANWAERLGGTLLPTGTIRLAASGRIEDLPGFAEGAWWVQDAAAALPARLLGDVKALAVADLCAAPGGKTAQLAAAGAQVTAVDISEPRLARVRENMLRLGLTAEIVAADIGAWQPGRTFDAVLLDLPCTATGTIRRNPDILRLKRDRDVAALAEVQSRLIAAAAGLVRLGGVMVVCVCSLEPEEGERPVEAFLTANSAFTRSPLRPEDLAGHAEWITPAGDLRTLPFHEPAEKALEGTPSGMDGFYAARLVRTA
jgi:16S rRNA (cytosine967-C5)-methyltransferase